MDAHTLFTGGAGFVGSHLADFGEGLYRTRNGRCVEGGGLEQGLLKWSQWLTGQKAIDRDDHASIELLARGLSL